MSMFIYERCRFPPFMVCLIIESIFFPLQVQEFGKVITLVIENRMMNFMPKPAVTTRLSCLNSLYRISKYIYFSSNTLIACGQMVVTLTLDGDY